MSRVARHGLVLALVGALALAAPWSGHRAGAQELGVVQSPLLVLDTDRLFAESEPGKLFLERYNAQRDALIARNRSIEQELREEEQALTEKRQTLTAEAFRDQADAFDEKVRRIRDESERASRDLERAREQAPFLLMRQAEAVLFEIMQDTGGVIILDARQVLVRSDAVDITDLAIERVNQAMSDQQVEDDGVFDRGGDETPGDGATEGGEPAEDAPDAPEDQESGGDPDTDAAPDEAPAQE